LFIRRVSDKEKKIRQANTYDSSGRSLLAIDNEQVRIFVLKNGSFRFRQTHFEPRLVGRVEH
jgi:hypothetical protein